VKTALLVVVSALASCSGGTGFKSVPWGSVSSQKNIRSFPH
jgi:hypothetical protein